MRQRIEKLVDEFFKNAGLTIHSTDPDKARKVKEELLTILRPKLSDEEYTIAWYQACYWVGQIEGNFYETWMGDRNFGLP